MPMTASARQPRAIGLALSCALTLAGCVAPAVREQTTAPASPPPASIPMPRQPLAALIARAPDLSRFRALAAAGGLERLLAGREGVTLLAPSDAAFARLPAGTVEALLQPGNRPSLLHLLRFWVVTRRSAADADDTLRSPTLEAEPISIVSGPDATMVVDAAGRRGYVSHRTIATDGVLVELNGIVAPRSIEPAGGRNVTPLRSP